MTCSSAKEIHQTFPRRDSLSNNLNLQLDELRQEAGYEQTVVYFYVVASVNNEGGRLVQMGSGPNFQGDVVTLCTCKHYMRTFLSPEEWEGKWIAGFTSVGAGGGRNALVYLTKIAHAFESHYDLWYSEEISTETKRAKSVRRHEDGDLFEPVNEQPGNPFDPRDYHQPHSDHSHAEGWHNDVDYVGCGGRRASLLVGDPACSYLWDRPMISYPTGIGRAQRKAGLEELLSRLEAG